MRLITDFIGLQTSIGDKSEIRKVVENRYTRTTKIKVYNMVMPPIRDGDKGIRDGYESHPWRLHRKRSSSQTRHSQSVRKDLKYH